MTTPPRGRWLLLAVVVVGIVVLAYAPFTFEWGGERRAEAATSALKLSDIPFDGTRAYGYLKALCRLGPRCSGSPGMAAQQKLLKEHFEKLGAVVWLQSFTAPDPRDGRPVPMANLIVHWKPARTERILLCAHYDTLPFPLRDRRDPRGVFVGANDGASGVALLMELGNEMASLECRLGIDFAFFDAEEYVFNEYEDRYFIGSEYFARAYRDHPPGYRYRWAVLLDMVADADLQIFQERNSMWWPDTRPLVLDLWATAERLGVREFVPRRKHEVRDDHLSLHDIAGIPACNVIDFDYPAWHTRLDTPERCSALSLAKVGWVLREWLRAVK